MIYKIVNSYMYWNEATNQSFGIIEVEDQNGAKHFSLYSGMPNAADVVPNLAMQGLGAFHSLAGKTIEEAVKTLETDHNVFDLSPSRI